jgi:AcrR family transcriptional regulator
MASKGERTRGAIVAAAERALLTGGGRLDVQRVAGDAGVSVGGLYHHFAGKDALLAAVVDAFHERFEREVVYAAFPGDWAERERRRVQRAVDFHFDDPLAPLLVARAADGVVARADAARLERAVRASAANLREAGLPAGLDADLVAAMLMGGTRQVLARALTLDPRPPRAEVAATLWALVERVVQPRSSGSTASP